jgi:Domain of unknown function (DUF6134)
MADGRGMAIHGAFVAALVLCTFLGISRALSQGQGAPEQLADLPSAGRLNYDVIRGGEKVGAHSVVFSHKGRHLAIKTRTDIAVELLGITLYRFHYEAEEDWVDGRLMHLTSRTNNDGETLTANLARAGSRIRGTCNGIVLDVPADLLPISVWHPDFVHQSVVLDQYKCVQRSVKATDDGIERILVGAKNVAAHHYAVTGELQRDVWYTPDGQTLQVLLPAKDGSKITFVMQDPSQSPTMEQRISNSSADTRRRARPSERK